MFSNLSEDVNIYDTNWAWGAIFTDFTHDGYEDLYIANGFFNDEKNEYFQTTEERKWVFLNNRKINELEIGWEMNVYNQY